MKILTARIKPYDVKCIQYDGTERGKKDCYKFTGTNYKYVTSLDMFVVETDTGLKVVEKGDYIAKFPNGDIYFCPKKKFEEKYEIMEVEK